MIPFVNYEPGKFSNIKADIVFLGVGLLSHSSENEIEKYWDETVSATNAKVVVPIHWDDFTKPLQEPLIPTPDIIDELSVTFEILGRMAENNPQISIYFMKPFKKYSLASYFKSGNTKNN